MNDPKKLFETGLAWLGRGEPLMALPFFEKSFKLDPLNSLCLSYMALLIGLERGQVHKALELGKEAIALSPGIPVLYVNLGKLYMKEENKENALEALRKSLEFGDIPEAKSLLNEINPRMRPVFSSLARGHLLNRCAGKLWKKIGLRRFRIPEQKKNTTKISLIAARGY